MPEEMPQLHTSDGQQNNAGKRPVFRKVIAIVMAIVMIASAALSYYAIRPQPASALLGVGDISVTAGDIPRVIEKVIGNIKKAVELGIKQMAINSLYNVIDNYVQNVAYETGRYLGSGGKGQKPLVFTGPVGDVFRDAADQTLGNYLDQLSTGIFGHSLCEPINPQFKLQLAVMLERAQQPRKPKCTFGEIFGSGGSFDQTFNNIRESGFGFSNLKPEDVVKFSGYFDPGANELAGLKWSTIDLSAKIDEELEVARLQREIFRGYEPVTNPIDGKIKTSAESVAEAEKQIAEEGRRAEEKKTELATAEDSTILLILTRALTTFSRTFIGEWTKQLFEDGVVPTTPNVGPSDYVQSRSGLAAARQFYKKLIEPDFSTEVSIDVTSQLANCPRDLNARAWQNCRIDPGFKQAIDQELTLAEAVSPEYGQLVNPNGIFGWNGDIDKQPDVGVGYPLDSITILRRYSIVPVGFELAAQYIKDVVTSNEHGGKETWSVQELMDCYEADESTLRGNNRYPAHCRLDTTIDCDGADPLDPLDDSANPLCVNPFYHLVNPNWVLKSPATQCVQEGPGPQIVHEEYIEVPQSDPFSTKITSIEQRIVSRADWCADEQRCIQEDEDTGDCDFYGYCVKDKPIIRFDAEKCSEPVYDTCRQLSITRGAYGYDATAAGSDRQDVAYLRNSLVECSAGAAGCSWYSTYFDPITETWEGHEDLNANATADRLYTNSNIDSCLPEQAGCTLLYELDSISSSYTGATLEQTLQNVINAGTNNAFNAYNEIANVTQTYLKIPPDYLGCAYGATDQPSACENFATTCSADEVGCELYKPIGGGPDIPGRITTADQCSEQCVGFAAFTYTPSWFEDASDGTLDGYRGGTPESFAFVPSTAQSCTQIGCEQFTNEDEVAQGGEGIENYTYIRQCVTPGSPNTKTYFTWEGSDQSGYQLRRWVMLEGVGGSPCSTVTPGSPTSCADTNASSCDSSSPTCLNLFDENGNAYEADLNSVVYSSDDCHPLRRSKDNVTYYGIPSLSQSCSAANVGCREYRGAGSNNVEILFVDNFDEISPETGLLDDGWSGGIVSNESLLIGGHSYSTESGGLMRKTVSNLEFNKYYTLQFLAKGGSLSAKLVNEADGFESVFATTNVTAEWGFYQIGPILLDHVPASDELLEISFNGFIDDIVLRESIDNYAFIEESWDAGVATTCAGEDAYNCRLYEVGSQETEIALKSFTSLCEEKYVGCTAFINSQNSTVSGPDASNGNEFDVQVWNADNNDPTSPNQNTLLDDIIVPADSVEFYVKDPEKTCPASARGCQIVGRPIFDRQQDSSYATLVPAVCEGGGVACLESSITSFGQVAIVNNPDTYSFSLCSAPDLFCSEFATSDGGFGYYLDPGNRVCEYRENVYIGSTRTTKDGWFKVGTDELCETTGLSPDQPVPTSQPLTPAIGSMYWAGSCPIEDDTCSQIIDRNTISGAVEEVYYIRHKTLEDSIAKCSAEGGVVDREYGCRLFADMSEYGTKPALYSAEAYDPDISLNGEVPQSSTVFVTDPVTGEDVYSTNDSNVLIWVEPDRVCDQFLHCASSLTLTDNVGGVSSADAANNVRSSDSICLGIGLCTQLDKNGTCVDGAAQILGQNTLPGELTIANDVASSNSAYTSLIDRAKWTTGFAKFGAVWPNGSTDGLFAYHHMQEIGSPITLPNSDFEDVNNFGHEFSSWPDVVRLSNGTTIDSLKNAKIVKESGGVVPYQGQRMLNMSLTESTGAETYVTTAALPAAQDLEMTVSFFVNFDRLIAPSQQICTAGHQDNIGQSCNSNVACANGPGVCTTDALVGLRFCKLSYDECFTDADCSGGLSICGTFTCDSGPNAGDRCDPNVPAAVCGVGNGCFFRGPASSSSVCTNGDAAKIGNACTVDGDCEATSGLCEDVTSGMTVKILRGDGTTVINETPVQLASDQQGWQQVSVPFRIAANEGDEFRVQLHVVDILGTGEIGGSVQVDGLEIRSGLKISQSKVVAPSCRLYANSESLACDYENISNVDGRTLQTYKGWRGYCVESVPDQASVCMNWWPVDVVQGDVNFFGAGRVVDVDLANDAYYCLQSTGSSVGYSGVDSNSSQPYQYIARYVRQNGNGGFEPSVTGAIIGTLVGGVIGGLVGLLGFGGDPSTDEVCDEITSEPGTNPARFIKQDCANTDNGQKYAACIFPHTFGGCVNGCHPDISHCTGRVVADSQERQIYKSQIESIVINKTSPQAEYPSWIVLTKDDEVTETPPNRGGSGKLDLLTGESAWYVNCNRTSPPQGDNGPKCASSNDRFEVAVIFDAQNRVKDYWWLMSDESGSRAESAGYIPTFVLRDVCNAVARVSTSYGAHTPWVDRYQNSATELFYESIDQDALPYGAVAPPSNDYLPHIVSEENPWIGTPLFSVSSDETLYCGNNFLPQECARSGTQYSCEGDCGLKRICISGPKTKLGNPCTSNTDCTDPDYPTSRGLCGGVLNETLSATASPTMMNHGVNRVKQLWARSYDLYGWDYEKGQYVRCVGNPIDLPLGCKVPATSMGQTGDPVVFSNYDITGCGWTGGEYGDFVFNDTFVCKDELGVSFDARDLGNAPVISGMSVKGRGSGDVPITSGEYVPLVFYPNVDENRQPLKGMKINWGDGTPLKPNQDLSNLAGQGLPITNYVFTHQYICGPNSDTDLTNCGDVNPVTGEIATTNCWESDPANPGEGWCLFVPKVQLKDNWGWCTGEIYQCGLGEGWVDFAGQVLVEPGEVSFGTCNLVIADSVINAGESTTLTWSYDPSLTPNSLTSQTGQTSFSGPNPPGSPSGSGTISTVGDWVPLNETYVLQSTGIFGDTVSCAASLTVNPTPPNCTLTPTSATVLEGTTVTLNWSINWADTGYLVPDPGAVGSLSLNPDAPADTGSTSFVAGTEGTYQYTLNISNTVNGLSGTCGTTVTVAPQAPQCTLTSSPSLILPGDQATLSWSVDYAHTSADIQPTVGNLTYTPPTGSGTVSVTPPSTSVYTLYANGLGGTTQCNTQVMVASSMCTDGSPSLIGSACLTGNDCIVPNDGDCHSWLVQTGSCEARDNDGFRVWLECGPGWEGECDISPCTIYECSLTGTSCSPGDPGVCNNGANGTCDSVGLADSENRCRAGWGPLINTASCPSGLDSECNSAGHEQCTPL